MSLNGKNSKIYYTDCPRVIPLCDRTSFALVPAITVFLQNLDPPIVYKTGSSGGIEVSGTATYGKQYDETPIGNNIISGSAVVETIYSEQQTITFENSNLTGQWILGYDSGYNYFTDADTSSSVQTALRNDPLFANWGDLIVTGDYAQGFTITASTQQPLDLITIDTSNFTYSEDTEYQTWTQGSTAGKSWLGVPNWSNSNGAYSEDGVPATLAMNNSGLYTWSFYIEGQLNVSSFVDPLTTSITSGTLRARRKITNYVSGNIDSTILTFNFTPGGSASDYVNNDSYSYTEFSIPNISLTTAQLRIETSISLSSDFTINVDGLAVKFGQVIATTANVNRNKIGGDTL